MKVYNHKYSMLTDRGRQKQQSWSWRQSRHLEMEEAGLETMEMKLKMIEKGLERAC